jgi:hypothetical protein
VTHAAARSHVGSVHRHLARRKTRFRQRMSERLFAGGDALVREHGWEVRETTGRFGYGARTYRDPRFSRRMAAARHRPGCPRGRTDARSR